MPLLAALTPLQRLLRAALEGLLRRICVALGRWVSTLDTTSRLAYNSS
jgi:hypothetical protein